jgi:hypothetical protein
MAISFVGLLEGQKGLAAEQAAAAKAQEDKEWRELIRQDSLDAKEQAQANFLRGIKDKRFTALAAAGTKYFNDRKPTQAMVQDLSFLKELVGEVEGGNDWLGSFGNNPALIAKAADAVRKAQEKNGFVVTGEDLVANFKIIGASNNPDAALQEFANRGDLYSQFAEGDIQDDDFYFDFLARASAPVAAPTTTYKIIDPKKLGMNQTTSEEYARQRTIWDAKTNDLLAESLRNLKKITDPDTDTQRKIDELGAAQLDAKAGDNAARDYLFGQTAWDILEEANRDQPQVFGSAFPRPSSGQSDVPAANPMPTLPQVDPENIRVGDIIYDPSGQLQRWNGNSYDAVEWDGTEFKVIQ